MLFATAARVPLGLAFVGVLGRGVARFAGLVRAAAALARGGVPAMRPRRSLRSLGRRLFAFGLFGFGLPGFGLFGLGLFDLDLFELRLLQLGLLGLGLFHAGEG